MNTGWSDRTSGIFFSKTPKMTIRSEIYSMKNYAGILTPVQAAAAFFCFILSPLHAEDSRNLFTRLDLFTSVSLLIPVDEIQNKTQCSIGMTTGMRVLFKDCDIRLYNTLPPATFTALNETSCLKDVCALADNPRYSVSFSLPQYLHIPLVIQAGTLTPGGSWTRLSSPEISSSVSPFSKTFSLRQGLSSSLPGTSSRIKSFAEFMSAGIPETYGLLKGSTISVFYRDDGTCAASVVCCINLPRMIRTGFSFTGGRFFLSNTSSTWFSDTAFFQSGWFQAASVQALFHSPVFLSLFTMNTYEQPLSKVRYTFRSENKLTFGRFVLMFAGFAADRKNIRCTDNSLLSTIGQLHAASQYTWRFASPRLPSLTAGTSCLVQRRYDRSTFCTYDDIKYTLGIQYTDRCLSTGLTYKASNFSFIKLTGKKSKTPEYSISARFSKTQKLLLTTAAATCTFSDSSAEETLKLTKGISGNKICASGSAAISCSQNNFNYKDGTASLVFTCSRLSKFFKYTVRIALQGTF